MNNTEIAYFAIKPIKVGNRTAQPGEIVPEANTWKYVDAYVAQGRLAPVLVRTLPTQEQKRLIAQEATAEV